MLDSPFTDKIMCAPLQPVTSVTKEHDDFYG
jgi:hypothetical protein